MLALWIILGLLGALIIFMILRTVFCKKPSIPEEKIIQSDINSDDVAKHLSEAVKIPTISMAGEFIDNSQPFYDYHKFLEKTYPTIHKTAEKSIINGFSLVYHFKGKDSSLKPAAILAHQDVVPAPPENWEVDPFSGAIKDGFIYGRGTQDMKGTQIALLEAMEKLLNNGFVPNRDVYFCFGHDEESATMQGAPKIVEWFKKQNIELEFVLDEGGTLIDGKLINLDKMIGLIGISEKGAINLKLTVDKAGGHASNPSKPSACALLGKSLMKIDKHPMPSKWTSATKQLFNAVAPYMPWYIKFVLVNRDILSPLLTLVFKKIPITNSVISTTFAQTMLQGSSAENVIPPYVKANINCRILTGSSRQEVSDYIQKLVGKNVKVSGWNGTEPTPESPTDSLPYENLQKSIRKSFSNIMIAPYMFIANSDARYYYDICKNVYRFTPFLVTPDDQKRIHAINERVSIEDMTKATNFFINCIETMC